MNALIEIWVTFITLIFVLSLYAANFLFALWIVLRFLGIPINIQERIGNWLYERQVKKQVDLAESRVDELYADALDNIAGELDQR